jgi:hypothetical protein
MTAVDTPCRGCGGAVAGRVLRVREPDDLAALTRGRKRYDAVELATERLAAPERERWEERLATAHNECGCHAGGLALLAGLAVVAVVGIVSPGNLTWSRALLGLSICVAAAVIGKLAGIVAAQVRLRRDVRRVASLLA